MSMFADDIYRMRDQIQHLEFRLEALAERLPGAGDDSDGIPDELLLDPSGSVVTFKR